MKLFILILIQLVLVFPANDFKLLRSNDWAEIVVHIANNHQQMSKLDLLRQNRILDAALILTVWEDDNG